MHREILLWYVAPATSSRVHSAGSGYYVCNVATGVSSLLQQTDRWHKSIHRNDTLIMIILITIIFKTPTRKDWVPWVEHTIKLSDVHVCTNVQSGERARTSARLQAEAEHQLIAATCHRHVSRVLGNVRTLSDWVTGQRNVLSVVRQVVLLLVTMRLLAECCPDHTCRRCLIMFGMWSKSPRRHLFCFLSNVPSSKAPSYFKNIWRHTLNEHLIKLSIMIFKYKQLRILANQIVMCYLWPDIIVCYLYISIIIKHCLHVWLAQCCPDLAASSRSSSSPVVTSDLQWSHHCHHHHHHDHHGDTQLTRAHHHQVLSGGHESGQWENENSLTLTFHLLPHPPDSNLLQKGVRSQNGIFWV